jgi:hypothetical protein
MVGECDTWILGGVTVRESVSKYGAVYEVSLNVTYAKAYGSYLTLWR